MNIDEIRKITMQAIIEKEKAQGVDQNYIDVCAAIRQAAKEGLSWVKPPSISIKTARKLERECFHLVKNEYGDCYMVCW